MDHSLAGVSFPALPRPSLGLAKATCHTNAQLPPLRSRLAPHCPSMWSLNRREKKGLGLISKWQGWDKDAGAFLSHQLLWILYWFLLALALCRPWLWFQGSASEHMLPTSLCFCL